MKQQRPVTEDDFAPRINVNLAGLQYEIRDDNLAILAPAHIPSKVFGDRLELFMGELGWNTVQREVVTEKLFFLLQREIFLEMIGQRVS